MSLIPLAADHFFRLTRQEDVNGWKVDEIRRGMGALYGSLGLACLVD